MRKINPLLTSVAYFEIIIGNAPFGAATGFFYRNQNDQLFLGTNKHVVQIDEESIKPDALKLFLHYDLAESSEVGTFLVPLSSASGDPLWKEHPTDDGIDLILIPLDEPAITAKFFIQAWSKRALPSPKDELDVGQVVSILGFPYELLDRKDYLPTILEASIFKFRIKGYPYFFVEANAPTGSSGSPVIIGSQFEPDGDEKREFTIDGQPQFLIGITSGNFDIEWDDGTETVTGQAMVWHAQLLEDIANA